MDKGDWKDLAATTHLIVLILSFAGVIGSALVLAVLGVVEYFVPVSFDVIRACSWTLAGSAALLTLTLVLFLYLSPDTNRHGKPKL